MGQNSKYALELSEAENTHGGARYHSGRKRTNKVNFPLRVNEKWLELQNNKELRESIYKFLEDEYGHNY